MNEPTEVAQTLYGFLKGWQFPTSYGVVLRNGSSRIDVDVRSVLRGLFDPVRILAFTRDDPCLRSSEPRSLKKELVTRFHLADNAIAIILHPTTPDLSPYPWIAIDPTEFLHDSKKQGRSYLKAFLLGRISLSKLNPYSSRRAVLKNMFFGRTDDTNQLRDDDANYVIVGPRRGGKTSFVYHLLEVLRENPQFQADAKIKNRSVTLHSATYVDMQRLVALDDLWEVLLRTMGVTQHSVAGGIGKKILLQPQRKLAEKPAFELLGDLIQYRFDKTLMILDEVDGALALDERQDWAVFSKLRALLDTTGGKARVVLVGYDKLYRSVRSTAFPLYGRCEIKRMANIEPEAVEDLIKYPMTELGLTFDNLPQIVELINTATGGMPNLIQDLCRELLQLPETQRTRCVQLRDVSDLIHRRRKALIAEVLNALEELGDPLPRLIAYLSSDLDEVRFMPMLKTLQEKLGLVIDPEVVKAALEYLYLHNVFQMDEQGLHYTFASDLVQQELKAALSDNDFAALLRALKDAVKAKLGVPAV